MEIAKIVGTFSVRGLNNAYVESLTNIFKKTGFENAFPVSITEDGILWDGNHRLAAAKAAGLTSIPHIIETPDNLRLSAHQRNTASSNALPETFVDHAEEIWELLASGKTQQAVADEIGWSREKVAQYAQLKKVKPTAWELIVTEFKKVVTISEKNGVTSFVTGVTITENLLRNILPLTEIHQLEIVNGLIAGTIKSSQVKKLCEIYSSRELFVKYASDKLLSQNDVLTFFKDCMAGLYQSLEQVEKAVKQANDEFEKTNSVRVLSGDCLELLTGIESLSCDAVVTDPPYMILDEKWDTFKDKKTFLEFNEKWIPLALDKIKSTGRAYIFWSQEFMFDFPFHVIPERFVFGNVLVWNYKNNTKPNNQKIYKHTWEPCFYFYGIDAGNLNLPRDKEWDSDVNNYDVFEFAQPQTNFTDKKEHPAQKPEKLISQLINIGSDIGDTILDCFAGAGTIGVACKKLKRKAILIERDPEYLKIINKRLNDV